MKEIAGRWRIETPRCLDIADVFKRLQAQLISMTQYERGVPEEPKAHFPSRSQNMAGKIAAAIQSRLALVG